MLQLQNQMHSEIPVGGSLIGLHKMPQMQLGLNGPLILKQQHGLRNMKVFYLVMQKVEMHWMQFFQLKQIILELFQRVDIFTVSFIIVFITKAPLKRMQLHSCLSIPMEFMRIVMALMVHLFIMVTTILN